jgi:starch phosphorylase
MMKKSMQTLAARFNSHRMLEDYVHRFYLPSAIYWNKVQSDRFSGVRNLTAWMDRVKAGWQQLRILETKTDGRAGIQAGGSLRVEVTLQLGRLSPNDLAVDIYYGRVDSKADFLDRSTLTLRDFTQKKEQTIFRGEIPCQDVGRFGFRVRVLPSHPLLSNPYALGLILWG